MNKNKQPSKVFDAQQNPKTEKHTSNQESSLKLALKASVARDQIPAEYRPKEGFRLTSLKPIAEKSPKDIRNDKAAILNNTHGIEIKLPIESNKIGGVSESKTSIKVGVEAKAVSEKSRGVFNTKGALDLKVLSDPKTRILDTRPSGPAEIEAIRLEWEKRLTPSPKNRTGRKSVSDSGRGFRLIIINFKQIKLRL